MRSIQSTEKPACHRCAPWRMPLIPTKTTPPGCARVEGDTATFLLPAGSASSGPRVGLLIHRQQLIVVEVGVLLRGGQRGVAEELLDGSEICAGVEKVSGERVSQGVR